MNRIILASLAIALSLSSSTISAQSRRQHNERRTYRVEQRANQYITSIPTRCIDLNYHGTRLWYKDGVYYREHGPSRFEIVRPPIGILVQKLHKATVFHEGKDKFYLCNGIVYRKVKTARGKMYEVYSYQIPSSYRR